MLIFLRNASVAISLASSSVIFVSAIEDVESSVHAHNEHNIELNENTKTKIKKHSQIFSLSATPINH